MIVLSLNELKCNNLNYLCDEIKDLGPKFLHSQAVEGFDSDFDFSFKWDQTDGPTDPIVTQTTYLYQI